LARQESLGLSDYARYGFAELEATARNINELETLIGTSCRENLKTLSAVANPDQALESLIDFSFSSSWNFNILLLGREINYC
jgi:hypothetical protein